MVIKPPHPEMSPAFEKKHKGQNVISLNGKVLATGKNSLIAYKKAKKIVPNLDKKDFLISRIYPDYVAGGVFLQ